jgi:hypothetical protein
MERREEGRKGKGVFSYKSSFIIFLNSKFLFCTSNLGIIDVDSIIISHHPDLVTC